MNGKVWLDAPSVSGAEGFTARRPGTIGFAGVSREVWDHRIGAYQVSHKWLKDRRGRTLSEEEIAHYANLIATIEATIHVAVRIDAVVEECGGWPAAFMS